ncbi:hypothetical protein [Chromobacterium violaceum]|uniref:hypothetical protein n=1 Tax=Chromobacterium violaceum TaxID=536 RepID=UPI001951323D|nr:hypothetical protein [Chromobacterium violaceum]QRO34487.1 hypothetical protein I6K04_07085 [Chromobacterium violaceum]QRQ15709.1 hypothetical protein I6K03_15645 [Chromobacterium violaceum]
MAITPIAAKQTDWKASSTTAGLASLYLMPDGSVWAGREGQKRGQLGEAYQIEAGGTKNTVLLPYPSYIAMPGDDTPAPSARAIRADADGKIWVAESSYGLLYRIDPGKLSSGRGQAEIVYQSPDGRKGGGVPFQFGGLAFQPKSPATGNKDLVWVCEQNHGMLYAFDAAAAPGSAPLVELQLKQDKVVWLTSPILQPGVEPVLWLLLVDYQTTKAIGAASQLVSVPAKVGVKVSDCKFTAAPQAMSMALRDRALYLGDSKGRVHRVDTSALGRSLQMLATLDAPALLLHMAVDGGGYLWVANAVAKGMLYVLSPSGEMMAALSLSRGATDVLPGELVWNAKDDTVLVADVGDNGRVMQVTLEGVPIGPVGPDGKAHYTISANPEHGTTKPGAVFAAPDGIKLEARSTLNDKPPIAIAVSLRVDPAEAGGHLGADGLRRNVLIPAAGYALKDLTAGDKGIQVKLIVSGRGLEDKVVFVGDIHAPTTSVSFDPKGPLRIVQGQTVRSSENVIVTTSPNDGRSIEVTIGAGAYFGNEANPESNRKVASGMHLPDITAGKIAGPVLVTAKSDEASSPLVVDVVPLPKTIYSNIQGNVHITHFAQAIGAMAFMVQGYKELDNAESGEVPVPFWPVRVEIAKESYDLGIRFKDTGKPNSTQVREFVTNEKGVATLPPDSMTVPMVFGPVTLEYQAAVDLQGNFMDKVKKTATFYIIA